VKGAESLPNTELSIEIERLKAKFKNADESKLDALNELVGEAAKIAIDLKRLNEIAAISGLVETSPDNPRKQRVLPVSAELARHRASYVNVMDKLMKHLAVEQDEDDDGLGEYE
jgi:hypothetical protein